MGGTTNNPVEYVLTAGEYTRSLDKRITLSEGIWKAKRTWSHRRR